MPTAPDINLSGTQVLVSGAQSALGVLSLDNKIMFGTVAKVSDLCDNVLVGNSVMFVYGNASRFIYGSTIYFLMTQDNISGVEVIPP